MAQRVVDQVGDHLHEEFLVAGDRKRRVEALNERLALVFGGRRERLRDLARHLCEVERPESRPPRAGLDLADAEQGVEGLEHALDVADRRVDRVARRAGRRVVARGFETTQARPPRGLRRSCAMSALTCLFACKSFSMRSNSRLKVRASAVRSSSVRLSGMRRLQSPSMRRRAVCRIESIRPRNCALSHSPPIVPSASVAATAQPKAVSTPVRIVSERRRSSPTRRIDPSASGVTSERMTSGFDSAGSSPSALLRFHPATSGDAGRGARRSPAIGLPSAPTRP